MYTAKPHSRACEKDWLVEISCLNLQAPMSREEETALVWVLGVRRVHLCISLCERGKDHGMLTGQEGKQGGDAACVKIHSKQMARSFIIWLKLVLLPATPQCSGVLNISPA